MVEKSYRILLTAGAERDLEALYNYIVKFDTPANAAAMLDKLLNAIEELAAFPERGSIPKELTAIGIQEYRQIFFKPYRIIYRVAGDNVYAYLVANERREMQTLLVRRLLDS